MSEQETNIIQGEAFRLLRDEGVDLVIGYREARHGREPAPCIVTDPLDVGRLTFDEGCEHNLAKYLVGPDGYLTSRQRTKHGKPKVAIVATPTTLQTLAGLIREKQFAREDLVILGITNGVPPDLTPDIQVGHVDEPPEKEEQLLAGIEALERMSPFNRWAWWQSVFARCIRCYACRQVCPFCYCEQCIAEENQPQWIDRSPSPANNRSWNVIRAFHLVGRCTGCGECERVCPARIPISLINKKLAIEFGDSLETLAAMLPPRPSAAGGR